MVGIDGPLELLTAAQMRAIERAAMDGGAASGLELMERAGRGVVEAMFEWRPDLGARPRRATVLCGPGNNGGDGYVVARLLKRRGWLVEVFCYGDPAKLPPDAAQNHRRWGELGEVLPIAPLADGFPDCDICIDALFGTGLARGFDATLDAVRQAHARGGFETVAVDMPSGLCSDSGRALGASPCGAGGGAFRAALAVTFQRPRLGHCLGDSAICLGRFAVKDIGLETQTARLLAQWGGEVATLVGAPERLGKAVRAHKYGYGHALVLSGGVGRGGAARLAARAALRVGAGLVTVGCPPAALIENAARLDAIMLRRIADADALAETLADRRINAVALGMGLGVNARTRAMVATALSAPTHPSALLDADALTAFADDPDALFALLKAARAARRGAGSIAGRGVAMTPHAGEFARLFPDIAARLAAPATKGPAYSRVDAARQAAARAGCAVLLKGPDTVIADPEGRVAVHAAFHERAAPWLATAGSGDVLAGLVAGLLARGFAPMRAAGAAAWLHAAAARDFGPGLIAEDLPERIPAALRDLGA